MNIPELSVSELQERLTRQDAFVLLDVRQPEEFANSRIAGSVLIPLGELAHRLDELDRQADIVVHCKSGMRSTRACELLVSHGFSKISNLIGGNDAWQQHLTSRQEAGAPKA